MHRPFSHILLFLLLSVFSATAQEQVPVLLFKHLDGRKGLQEPILGEIYKDSYGLLWIASENGLARFDGISCAVYRNDPDDSTSISGNYIVNIIEDRNHDLWIGTQRGLSRYNRSRDNFTNFSKFRSTDRLNGNYYAFPFFIDDQEKVWAYLAGDIYVLDPLTLRVHLITPHSNGHIFVSQSFYTPLRRAVSRGVKGIYINELDGRSEIDFQGYFMPGKEQPVTYVEKVLMESDSLYWLCTDIGLILFNPRTRQYTIHDHYQDKKPLIVNCIAPLPDKPGLYLAGTSGQGLLVFDKNRRQFTAQYKNDPLDPQSLSSNTVNRILIDKDGNLFLVLKGHGIDYTNLKRPFFERFFSRDLAIRQQVVNNVTTLCEDAYCRLWLGTKTSGIVVLDPDHIGVAATYFKQCGVIRLFPLSEDQLLAELSDGTFHICDLQTSEWTKQTIKGNGLSSGKILIHQFVYLPDSTLVAATENGLAQLTRHGHDTLQFDFTDAVGKSVGWPHIQRIIPLDAGNVLIQTFYTNLYLFHYGPAGFRLKKQVAPGSFYINGSVRIRDTLFLATSAGLLQYDIRTEHLHARPLLDIYATGLLADRDSNLWITTTNGLYRYKNHTSRKYLPEEGLQDYIFNADALISLHNHQIAAGGINGINVFNPLRITDTYVPYDIFLMELQINDKPYKAVNPLMLRSLDLPYYLNTLNLTCTPVCYDYPEQKIYYYQLIGYDVHPVPVKGKWSIRYVQLPPGSYRLELSDEHHKLKKVIDIRIMPPFWLTWWFSAFMIALSGTLIIFYIRYRIRSEKRKQLQRIQIMIRSQEEERKRIARDLHDDFGARLSTLKMYIQAADKDREAAPGLLRRQAGSMIDQTIRELRNILLNLSPKTLAENGLQAAIHDMADNLARLDIIQCNVDTANLKARLKPADEYSLFRICQELINNTIKHAKAQHIYISLVQREKHIVFLYEDDGTGFDGQQTKKGYGLTNIETHVQALHATLFIDSQPGKGTAVTIGIPV